MSRTRLLVKPVAAAAPALVGVLLLAGCGISEPPPPCPPSGIPPVLKDATTFVPGGGEDLTEVLHTATFDGLQLTCDYEEDGVELEVAARIIAERGPADRERRATVSYFVAVERGVGNIVAKQVYTVELPFEGNRRRVGLVEEFDVFVPRPADGNLRDLRIIGGLQLTPEQLEYNRRIAGG